MTPGELELLITELEQAGKLIAGRLAQLYALRDQAKAQLDLQAQQQELADLQAQQGAKTS